MKFIKKIIKSLCNKRRKIIKYIGENKNLKRKKSLYKDIHLNEKQIKNIDKLWIDNYGKKISKDYHKLYTSYTGVFDEKYFPEILFTTNLLDKLNPPDRKKYLSDKALIQYFFGGGVAANKLLRIAKNYIYNCSGYFYDDNRNNRL